MGAMTVFHGSSVVVREPRVIKGRFTKDFGAGFYCTTMREQAVRWARRLPTPMVNEYRVLLRGDLDVLEFKEMTDPWLDFIASCRQGLGVAMPYVCRGKGGVNMDEQELRLNNDLFLCVQPHRASGASDAQQAWRRGRCLGGQTHRSCA